MLKTANAITINDNVIINGSLQFTTKTYAEFYAAANSVNYTTEITVPIDTTRYNTGSFSLAGNEITINASMIINITFKVGADCAVGVANTVVKSFLQLSTDGVNFTTVDGSNIFTDHKATNFGSGSASSSHILSAFAGSKIRLRTVRNTGADTMKTLANACNIVITQL